MQGTHDQSDTHIRGVPVQRFSGGLGLTRRVFAGHPCRRFGRDRGGVLGLFTPELRMEGPIPCRARSSVPSPRAGDGGTAPTSRHAEPAGGSDVEIDVVLGAARRQGVSRVEYHGYTMHFDSWNGRSIVHSNRVQVQLCQQCRTARQRRSHERNTRAAYEQRWAKRLQQDKSATAKVGSSEQTEPANVAAATAADAERPLLAAADGRAERLEMPPGLEAVANAAMQPPSPSLAQPQQPEPTLAPVPAPEPLSDDETTNEMVAAEAEAAETMTDVTVAVAATATSTAAVATATGTAAGEAMAADGEAAGVTAVDASRRGEWS